MEITPNAKIVDSDIYKAVIRVTERMSYTDVQKSRTQCSTGNSGC